MFFIPTPAHLHPLSDSGWKKFLRHGETRIWKFREKTGYVNQSFMMKSLTFDVRMIPELDEGGNGDQLDTVMRYVTYSRFRSLPS